MKASGESAGRSRSQHSQFGRSSSIVNSSLQGPGRGEIVPFLGCVVTRCFASQARGTPPAWRTGSPSSRRPETQDAQRYRVHRRKREGAKRPTRRSDCNASLESVKFTCGPVRANRPDACAVRCSDIPLVRGSSKLTEQSTLRFREVRVHEVLASCPMIPPFSGGCERGAQRRTRPSVRDGWLGSDPLTSSLCRGLVEQSVAAPVLPPPEVVVPFLQGLLICLSFAGPDRPRVWLLQVVRRRVTLVEQHVRRR